MVNTFFNKVSLSPENVLAGDGVTLKIKLEIGVGFSAGKSRILIDFPTYLGASRPTTLDQENDDILS